MAGPTVDLPAQVSGGGEPATTMTGPAAGTIRTAAGSVGTVADALVFATGTGAWVLGNQRTRSRAVPLVSATAIGTRTLPGPPGTAPVAVTTGSAAVRTS